MSHETPVVFVVDDGISVRKVAGTVNLLRGVAAQAIRVRAGISL
jgi:hypothetical protein